MTEDWKELAKAYQMANPHIPVVEHLDAKILREIESGEGKLDMKYWHFGKDGSLKDRFEENFCGTTHCRAGWAVILAGKAGLELEAETDAATAGSAIYLASTGHTPNFYTSTENGLAEVKRCAALDPLPLRVETKVVDTDENGLPPLNPNPPEFILIR